MLSHNLSEEPGAKFRNIFRSWCDAVTELEELTFNCHKQKSPGGIDANLDTKKNGNGGKRDVVVDAKLRDEMDDKFLNQVCAVGNAGDECGARDCNPAKWQSRTQDAHQQRGHAKSDEGELPDAGGDGEVLAFAQI